MEGGVSSQYIWSLRSSNSPVACLYDNNGDDHKADGDVNDDYAMEGAADWRCYYTTDANGNVTTAIRFNNSNVQVASSQHGVRHYGYTAYGTMTVYNESWSVASDETQFDGPRYCGYWYDNATWLYQVRNRYYDPALERFINRDPIGYQGGTSNLYCYCGCNPINATDPSGTQKLVPLYEQTPNDVATQEAVDLLVDLAIAGMQQKWANQQWADIRYELNPGAT